ncbi:MAG: DUF2779 domain-containing protein [Rhodoferax sp.]|nr:DUF2779 domain-containing protein [Rhodoferax sp.]
MALRQCSKRLWLEIHRPELRADSSGAETRFQVGYEAGEVARQLYDPSGQGALIDIDADGFNQAFVRSASLLQTSQPIFEAAFSAGGALAFADVMFPEPGTTPLRWRMVEVKSSTRVKDYHRDDVAVQSYVALAAGIPVSSIAVACIDSSWVYPGGGNYVGLLQEHDLTAEAKSRQEEVQTWIAQAQEIAAQDQEPPISIGTHCDEPFECGFYTYCSRNESQPEYPVFWLPHISGKLIRELAEEGVNDMRNVPNALLNERQLRVKHHTLAGTVYFDATGAAQDLSEFPLPVQFLDFETIQFAVPIWAGTRPYQQIPFQYSLHTLTESGELQHYEFLGLDGGDPSLKLALALIAGCGTHPWPIFAYNAGFEKSRIRELAERFPEHAAALHAINARIVDLLPIARTRYYNPNQHGSWSIKAVLPAAVPDLRYSDLEGVQDGGMAMEAFLEALHPETTPELKQTLQQQLLAYCKLDTYAMVRLWQVFAGRTDLDL